MDDLFGKIVEESAKIISGRVEAQYQDDSKKAAEKKAAEEERSKAGHPEDDVFKDIIKREL